MNVPTSLSALPGAAALLTCRAPLADPARVGTTASDVQAGQGEYTNRIVFDSTFRMLSNYLM